MKKIICLLSLVLMTACSTTNIIVVADKEFMDEVKNDYNKLFIEQAVDRIKMMETPKDIGCPLMRELYNTWPDKQAQEY